METLPNTIMIKGKGLCCTGCKKEVVHPEDFGDYDDAGEWACQCELDNTRWAK